MNYKKTITMLAVMATSLTAIAQTPNTEGVSISSGVTPPHPSAMLDVSSSNKGVLIPRVSLTGLGDQTTVPNPETSLLVYNEGTAIAKGYYFWDGTNWSPLGGGATNNGFWQQSTINPNDIYTLEGGSVGIGTNTPHDRLQLGQEIIIHDGGTKFFGRNAYWNPSWFNPVTGTVTGRTEKIFSERAAGSFSIDINGAVSMVVDKSINNPNLSDPLAPDFCWAVSADADCDAFSKYHMLIESDSNLKENIKVLDNSLTLINSLKPKLYNFIGESSEKIRYGFLAQDVEQILPTLVKNRVVEETTVKAIRYTSLIPILTGAIQEQQATITTLQATVNSLLERVQVLENR